MPPKKTDKQPAATPIVPRCFVLLTDLDFMSEDCPQSGVEHVTIAWGETLDEAGSLAESSMKSSPDADMRRVYVDARIMKSSTTYSLENRRSEGMDGVD